LMIDVIGFLAWMLTGQIPPSAFFIGGLSKFVLSLIY
jgi:hypothetical protein